VEDIAAELSAPEPRGVAFEDYDLPGLKTVNHIAESATHKAAWFTDTEGNILCLHQAWANKSPPVGRKATVPQAPAALIGTGSPPHRE
jgi:hypothetical protein